MELRLKNAGSGLRKYHREEDNGSRGGSIDTGTDKPTITIDQN